MGLTDIDAFLGGEQPTGLTGIDAFLAEDAAQNRSIIEIATAPFLGALEQFHEQFQRMERGEPHQFPDPSRAIGGVFPGFEAGRAVISEAVRSVAGEQPTGPPREAPSLAETVTGFESGGPPVSRDVLAEVAGLVGGGGVSLIGRRIGGAFGDVVKAARGSIPRTPEGPPPEFARALGPAPDVIPAPGPVRTFEAPPADIAPPGRASRAAIRHVETGVIPDLPREVVRDAERIERIFQYPIGKTPKDVATKAALINQAERAEARGPRVIDPATGRPVFEPTERIGATGGVAEARAGREPAGRPDLPSEELAASLEAPGARVAGVPQGRQPGPTREIRTYEIPEDTPIAGGVDLPRTPSDVATARAAERPFPPETARTWSFMDWLWNKGVEATIARSVSERTPLGLSPAEVLRRFNLLNLVTKSDPATANIVNAGQRSAEEYGIWLRNWQQMGEQIGRDAAGKPLTNETMTKALRIMQRNQENTLEAFRQIQREVPTALPAMRAWRQLNDRLGQEAVRRGRLTPDDLKHQNYVPFWRDKTSVGEKILLQVDNYFPVYIENSIPKPARLAFQKARTLNTTPDLDWENTWRLQGAAMGRMFAIDDVFMPVVRENLPAVGDAFKRLARVVVNNHLGVSGYSADPPREITRLLKTFASARTLGLSPSSPLHNMTQMLNTFADATTGEFAAGVRGLTNEATWTLARKRGIISSFTKADLDRAAEFGSKVATQLSRGVTQATTWSLGMFRGSEQVLRVQSFATGLARAANKGLTGEKAVSFASDFVRKNQFALGAETGILTQFKPFVTGQTIRMFEYAKDGAAGAEVLMKGIAQGNAKMMREGLQRMSGPAKYWIGATLLFGGDVSGANWAVEGATEKMFGERLKIKGLVPALGLTMANQVALGVLPIQSLRDFYFFLPGPFMAGVADAVSAMTYFMGVPNPDGGTGFRVNPTDMATGNFGQGFRPEDVGEVIARANRAFPGVQANRLREFGRAMANSGYDITGEEQVRLPTSVPEAMGLEPSRGELIRRAGGEEKLLRLFGVGLEQAEEEREARQRVQQRERDVADTRSSAGTLFKAGQVDRMFAELEGLARRHGPDAAMQAMSGLPDAITTAFTKDVLTRLERQVLTGPRAGLPGRARVAEEPRSIEAEVGRALLGR